MSSSRPGRTVEILLVEDNPGDVDLVREALQGFKGPSNLHVASDGVQAVSYLRREGRFANAPRPDLVLLDLNLPRKDGRAVLREVKADESLRRIPVVVLTTSSAEDDILMAYDLHANCYITKPLDFVRFAKVLHAIDEFWMTVVTLPPVRPDGWARPPTQERESSP